MNARFRLTLGLLSLLSILLLIGCTISPKTKYNRGGLHKAFAIGNDEATGSAWTQKTQADAIRLALVYCEQSTTQKGTCKIVHVNGAPFTETVLWNGAEYSSFDSARKALETSYNNGRIVKPDYKSSTSLTLHIDDPSYWKNKTDNYSLLEKLRAWKLFYEFNLITKAIKYADVFSDVKIDYYEPTDPEYTSESRINFDQTDYTLYFSHSSESWSLLRNSTNQSILIPFNKTLSVQSVPQALSAWLNEIASAHYRLSNGGTVDKKAGSIKESEILAASSGTGFFVTKDGHIITNNHVIDGCNAVKVYWKGNDHTSTVIAADMINDLALLKTNFKPAIAMPLSANNSYLMQDVFVAGFPFGKAISSLVKITKGIVSSLTGIGNNYSNMQIDAALQPGNSGGPIVDDRGNVVGVVIAKLSLQKVIKEWGVIPENTNFGIKSSVVYEFLKSNKITPNQPRTKNITKQQLAKNLSNGTVYISCWMTYAKIKQMKSQKVMFSNFK